jgi:hypothetical protein
MINSDRIIRITLALAKIKEQIKDIELYIETLRISEMTMSKKEIIQLIDEEKNIDVKQALRKVIFDE